MAKARIASKTQSKLGTILFGEPFTGKSTLASQLAYFKRPDGKPFKILYLDPESGSIDDYLDGIESNNIDIGNIYIVYTQSLGEVRQYIAKVKNNEDFYEIDDDGNETDTVVVDADDNPFRADAIVVDGATILNLTTKQGLVEFSKKRNSVKAKKEGLIGDEKLVKIENAGLELKDYNTINFKGQDLILDLMSSGVHYVVTARETDEKQQIKLPDGTTNSVVTGKKIPDGFKGMDYNAKTVIRMFRDENNNVCAEVRKDRTGVHADGEVLEDPSFLDWQVVIDKTAKNKEFVIKNDLTKSVEIEQNIYKSEILGTSETVNDKATDDSSSEIENIREEISLAQKALSPIGKTNAKKALSDAGIPTAISKIEDVETLKKALEILQNSK